MQTKISEEDRICDLIESNIWLVTYCIGKMPYKWKRGTFEFDDLYSAGCVSLWKAARTFDEKRSKFSTWAMRLIKQGLIDESKKIRRASVSRPSAVPISECFLEAKEERPFLGEHLQKIVESMEECDSKSMLIEHHIHGNSLSEIASRFGMSKESVRKKINKFTSDLKQIKIKELEEIRP